MQVEYKKEGMDTYLWIQPDQLYEDSYVEQMLLYNQGEGRLEFSRQEKEGEEYFCYKITGRKALNSIYAMLPIGERQIRGILSQLFTTIERAGEYLLSEEDFLISPNYIFATFPQMDMEFCYVPGYGVPLKEQLEGLFEYLLNRVDYDDKKAVELLYDCYMFCTREQGGIAEMKHLLEKDTEEEDVEEAVPRVTEPVYETKRVEYRKSEPAAVGKKEKESPNSYVSWLAEKLFHRRKKEIPVVAEEREEYHAAPASVLTPVLPQEEMERTVLLSVVAAKEELLLTRGRTGEIIPLEKFPFYIGSASEYVDYVPTGEGISRIHCCISKKAGKYYLADLNSTNGTFLNQKEVLPGKDEVLSANDEIRIATEEFYVKFSCH